MKLFRYPMLVLPLAAVILAAVTGWKLTRPPQHLDAPRQVAGYPAPAPLFELEDIRPHDGTAGALKPSAAEEIPGTIRTSGPRVRLATYLGRHRIVVAFFDPTVDLESDAVLPRLRDRFAALEHAGYKVFAVAAGTQGPVEERIRAAGPFPFPVLRDPNGFACLKWGRAEFTEDGRLVRTLPGLFVIDRAGNVPSSALGPIPEADPLATIDQLAPGN